MKLNSAVLEIVPIPDTFCSGVSKVEHIGHGLVRFYVYTVQGSACGEGPPERVLVAKVVMPLAAIEEARETLRRALAPNSAGVGLAAPHVQ